MNTPVAQPTTSSTLPRTFAFQALRADGDVEEGEISVSDDQAAIAALSSRGLFPIMVTERRQSRRPLWGRTLPSSDLAIGLRILATLLESGLPLRRASSMFGTLAPKSWVPVSTILVPSLREGRTITSALAGSVVAIPDEILGIVRAGEAGGTVANALRAAADLAENSAATRSAIRAALAYPAILALTGAASTAVLVGVVLPRFAAILADLGQELPATTKFVLLLGSLANQSALPMAGVVAVAFVTFRIWLTNDEARQTWASWLLKAPLIGSLRQAAATGRFCAALSALLDAGVSLPAALTHAANAAGDAEVSSRIRNARDAVVTGRALGAALEDTRSITRSASKLVRAGEETGSLTSMLAHAARLERERSIQGMRRLVRFMEPSLVVLFASIIAVVAAALLQAVYSVRPA